MPACPSCRRTWTEGRETCPECLAVLVDDLDATIECPECGRSWPTRMHSCPDCLALLRPDEEDLSDDVARVTALGLRMHRPAGREPFAFGPGCSVLRLRPKGGLVVCGGDGLVEANLRGPGVAARPPLTCTTDGEVLFRLDLYEPADQALVAVGGDGAALATFLRVGGPLEARLEVRDETSAPVAAVGHVPGLGGLQVVETGGGPFASLSSADVEQDGWVDDQWSLVVAPGYERPLDPLALVALAVAAKVVFGRAEPVRLHEQPDGHGEVEDVLGAIGRSIIDSWDD